MDATADDLERARARAAEATARMEAIRDSYADLRQRLLAVTASATSDDGLVTVRVGPQGRVLRIDLDPRIYRRPDSRRLAETITATIQRAADEAAERLREVLRPVAPDEQLKAYFDNDFDGVVEDLEGDLAGGDRR
jgi:DNA-binding protein YbaB